MSPLSVDYAKGLDLGGALGGGPYIPASQIIGPAAPVNVENFLGTDTQKWQAAIAAAVAQTTATTIGVVTAPAGKNYGVTATLDAPARIGLACAGARITTPGGFDALVIGPTDGANAAQGAGQRPVKLAPPEIISTSATPFAGTARGLTLRSMPEARVIDAHCEGFPVAFDMIANCFGAVWVNPHCRAGQNRIGMRLRGVNLAGTDFGAGNDITLENPWIGGRDGGLWIDPRGGAYHAFGGQINAGEGLAAADDSLGAIAWGRNLDNLADIAAAGGIDLNNVSFEGTQYMWNIRGYHPAVLRSKGCTVRSNIPGKPQIGVIKTDYCQLAAFDNIEVYGPFTSPTLAVVAFTGGAGDEFAELNSVISATVGAAADGTGGASPPIGVSMVSQLAAWQGISVDRPFIAGIANSKHRVLLDGNIVTTAEIGTAFPTPGAWYQGKQFILKGVVGTIGDTLYVCLMKTDGTWGWKQIVTG